MKFVRIKHYVEDGFEYFPGYLIVMEVNGINVDYISNGCVFVENTEENRNKLNEKYNCKEQLDGLFLTKAVSNNELVDGRYMFCGCEDLTEFKIELPKLEKGRSMFKGCIKLNDFDSKMPLLTNDKNMFKDCNHIKNFKCSKSNLNPSA